MRPRSSCVGRGCPPPLSANSSVGRLGRFGTSTQGADLNVPPEPAPDARKPGPKRKAAPRRKAPRAFKRRNQNLGRMIRPIILDAPPHPFGGGFGLAANSVPDPAGHSIPLDGWGDPMGDGRHLQKVKADVLLDLTPTPPDERTWDQAEQFDPEDPDLDDLPPGRFALLMESGEVREL